MTAVNLSSRIPFVNLDDGTLTPEAYRSLSEILNRTGGILGNSGGDVFFSSVEAQQSAGGYITGDTFGQEAAQAMSEMTQQPESAQAMSEMVLQPIPDRAMTAPEAVTVTASPFTYRAQRDGFFVVTGGTVSKQEYGRRTVFTDVGLTSMLPILLGDAIRVTYSAAPTITFIPR